MLHDKGELDKIITICINFPIAFPSLLKNWWAHCRSFEEKVCWKVVVHKNLFSRTLALVGPYYVSDYRRTHITCWYFSFTLEHKTILAVAFSVSILQSIAVIHETCDTFTKGCNHAELPHLGTSHISDCWWKLHRNTHDQRWKCQGIVYIHRKYLVWFNPE